MPSERSEGTRDWPDVTDEVSGGLSVGQLVGGRYEVLRKVGRGGMGTVYEVRGRADGRRYALKACGRTGRWARRFAREVRLMARVKHPNVVPVLDFELGSSPPFFVMPLAVGSLADELHGLTGREDEALDVFRQACLGVQAIHHSGIVHRDIKPANILRFRNGRVAVSDLGVAKLENRDTTALTWTRAVVGTLGFLAPEQLLPYGSRRADARTDVYQLGKVLYQLLTGRSPALIEPSAIPTGLTHLIQRATSVNPDDRYRDIAELLDALRYYRLARNPARNSREVLESLALQAEDLLRQREYRAENVREILALLSTPDRLRPAAAIERFDRLPDALLPLMVAEFPADFLPVLRDFAAALRVQVATFPFSYADRLARRMRRVFLAARNAEVKATALQVTLLAAVELNRFAAMDAFNRLLTTVRSVEVALPVAEMLRAHPDHYAEVARGAPPDRLHPVIREIQQDLLSTVEFSSPAASSSGSF
jgi:hypothetical protein